MIDLKRFREDKGIKQDEIQQILDCKQPYISAIESGRRKIGLDTYEKLYKVYGDELLPYLLNDDNIAKTSPPKKPTSDVLQQLEARVKEKDEHLKTFGELNKYLKQDNERLKNENEQLKKEIEQLKNKTAKSKTNQTTN